MRVALQSDWMKPSVYKTTIIRATQAGTEGNVQNVCI